jgi:hypothetical protein
VPTGMVMNTFTGWGTATDTSMHHSDLATPAWYYSEHATR